jgi:transcriptional regulator NrdR family protein
MSYQVKLVKNIDLEKGVTDKFKKPRIFDRQQNRNENKIDQKQINRVVRHVKHELYSKGKMHFGFKL